MKLYWYWLSFVDKDKFLGACIVPVVEDNIETAVKTAYALGCNPGGEVEVAGFAISQGFHLISLNHVGRLMDKEEAEAIDEKLEGMN